MPQHAAVRPSVVYWLAVAVLLLWAVGGASIYVAYFVETPAEFASTAEAPENRDAYAAYIAAIPAWAIGIGIVAAAARLAGAVGLLLRRSWALPCYAVALLAFLVALYRAFVMARVAEVMSPAHIATEGVFLSLSIFAIWFARHHRSTGVLR